jgi:hypothetical protein
MDFHCALTQWSMLNPLVTDATHTSGRDKGSSWLPRPRSGDLRATVEELIAENRLSAAIETEDLASETEASVRPQEQEQ